MPDDQHGMRRRVTDYGDRDFALYLRKSFAKSMGYSDAMLDKPVVGIADTSSDLNNCHRTVPELIVAVKRGALAAGALPLAFPTLSLCEPFVAPSTMHLRNLMAMDTEAMLNAAPMDSAVLVGGCDKTVPAQLMAAASADIPAVLLVTGPMLATRFEGERLSACTDCRRYWARFRAGDVDQEKISRVEGALATTAGTCGVMGTASTMACIAEALGMILPGSAAIPAVHADRLRVAEATGTLAATLKRRPSEVMTEAAFENALRVLLALSGSTNAIVHLAALAGRLGIPFDLRRFDALSDSTPVLVDLKPTGEGYMEDFSAAGGMRGLLATLRPLLNLDAVSITGERLGDRLDREARAVEGGGFIDRAVIRGLDNPVSKVGGLVALFGSLAPRGAILKRAAATESLFEGERRAVVFSSLADLAARIDDPDLNVTPEDALVLQNAGPIGAPGMPEAGYVPIPRKLARAGVKDMVRISDARMSGTAFGTIVLHVAPEAAAGGPLALVRSGDRIRLSVRDRRLDVMVEDAELGRRRALWRPPETPARGWDQLYATQVTQADQGADLQFLRRQGG
jgi:dihydroxy-acid dehydratase